MANILFNSHVIKNTEFISILEMFIKRGHNCLFVGKFEKSDFFFSEENFSSIYLDFEKNKNDSLILYELSKFYDYGITYGNEPFVNSCDSKFKIGLINDSLELIYYNYQPGYYAQRSYEDKIEKIYCNSIFSLTSFDNVYQTTNTYNITNRTIN